MSGSRFLRQLKAAALALFIAAIVFPAHAQESNGGGTGGEGEARGESPGRSRGGEERRPRLKACPPGMIAFEGGCTRPSNVIIYEEEAEPVARPKRERPPKKQPKPPKKVATPTKAPPPAEPPPPPLRKPNGIAGFDLPGRACLDPDLYRLLTSTYGARADLSSCNAGCVPRPAMSLRSGADLDRLAASAGVNWCPDDCIRLAGYLPVEDVLKLEGQTGRDFCLADGASLCRVPGFAAIPEGETMFRLRALVDGRPPQPPRPNDIAVVIGVANYDSDWPQKETGTRDSLAVRTLLQEKLGYEADNIISFDNPNDVDFDDIFGEGGMIDEKKPAGSIFIYISAHGIADPETGDAYILPVDALPEDPAGSAYPLDALYAAIGRIGARSATVVLEVDFATSPAALIDPPNLPEADIAVLPRTQVPGLSVFTAADRDQRTLSDPELGTGLFTRYVLEGLAGSADDTPIGNSDKRIEAVELYVYVAHRVRVAARKAFGLEQKPLLAQAQNMLIGQY